MRYLIPILALLAAGIATGAEPPPVSYFDAVQVHDAFAKGAVLFDGAGRNYMVHASRREQAGQGELHTLDADIIYVLDGSATFVTGGTLVEPKETAPNEIRGAAVAGGETRTIGNGRRDHRPRRHAALVQIGAGAGPLLRGEGPMSGTPPGRVARVLRALLRPQAPMLALLGPADRPGSDGRTAGGGGRSRDARRRRAGAGTVDVSPT